MASVFILLLQIFFMLEGFRILLSSSFGIFSDVIVKTFALLTKALDASSRDDLPESLRWFCDFADSTTFQQSEADTANKHWNQHDQTCPQIEHVKPMNILLVCMIHVCVHVLEFVQVVVEPLVVLYHQNLVHVGWVWYDCQQVDGCLVEDVS